MIRTPYCDICKYYFEEAEINCCEAFPEKIPLDTMVKAGPGVECAPGYTFEEREDDRNYKEPSPDGLYSHIMDCMRKLKG